MTEKERTDIDNKRSDENIIAMLEARDDRSPEILETKFGGLIRSISFGILENEQDAEECVNDVLLKIWNSIPPGKPEDLKSYIAAVAKNNALDRYKAERRKSRIPPDKLEPLESADNIGAREIDTEDKEAVAAAIAKYLGSVSTEKRKYFIAKYYYGAKDAEIAKKAGVPAGTVSSALSRMRKELETFLKAEGVNL